MIRVFCLLTLILVLLLKLMLLLVIQVWGPPLISHFPVCTPSDSFPPAERLGERSPEVSEEVQQRHRVAGPDCPLKDVLCSQTHSWDLPLGCAQCTFCTQMCSCICFARMTLLAVDRAGSRQWQDCLEGPPRAPIQTLGLCADLWPGGPPVRLWLLLAGLLPSRPMRGITGHPSPSPGSQLTCFGI